MGWHTILVPHDFSPSSNHATAIARDEANQHDAKIILIHVVEPLALLPSTATIPDENGMPISVEDYAVRSARTHLDDLIARLAKDGAAASGEVHVGNPAEQIVRAAEQHAADLIVMGAHGHGGVRKLVAGNVTEKVLRTALVPVLVVRHPG